MIDVKTDVVVKDKGLKQLERNLRDLFLKPSIQKFKEETFQKLNKRSK